MQPIIPIVIIVVFMAVLAGLAYLSLGFGAAILGYGLMKAKFGSATKPAPWIPPQPPATGWIFQYSANMVAGQTPEDFDFPTKDGAHYCVKRAPALVQGQTITMKFTITGTGTLVPVQGTKPWLTLYMQRAGDNLGGQGPYEYYRAWAGGSSIVLGPGNFTVSVPLTSDKWGSVMGHNFSTAPDMFVQLLANAQSIGFTFGDPSAGATGHGVYVKDGTAHFHLDSYSVG